MRAPLCAPLQRRGLRTPALGIGAGSLKPSSGRLPREVAKRRQPGRAPLNPVVRLEQALPQPQAADHDAIQAYLKVLENPSHDDSADSAGQPDDDATSSGERSSAAQGPEGVLPQPPLPPKTPPPGVAFGMLDASTGRSDEADGQALEMRRLKKRLGKFWGLMHERLRPWHRDLIVRLCCELHEKAQIRFVTLWVRDDAIELLMRRTRRGVSVCTGFQYNSVCWHWLA